MDGIDSYMSTDGAREPEPTLAEAAMQAVETHEIRVGEAVVRRIGSPQDTSGWRVERRDGIETFIAPDDVPYVRARLGEDADVIVSFTRIPGMMDMALVEASESATVKRAARKKRREQAELRKRGYDV